VKIEKTYTKILVSILIIMLLIFIGCSRKGIPPRNYTISGTVTLNGTANAVAGVTMQLTGVSTGSATTGSDGKFSFTGLANGTYSITPSLTDYSFVPISTTVVISDADVGGQDFTAILTGPVGPYSISGKVTGDVLKGVTITLSGTNNKTTTTDISGNYSFTSLVAGGYTVTPSLADYGFNPANRNLTISGASQSGKDFTATLIATSTYAQSDLTGRWRFHELTAGGSAQWLRAVVNIDSSGVITCESREVSTGASTCPASVDLIWTIDEDGKITESGDDGNAYAHMTMAANKNFIAGTGSLRIAQKITNTFSTTDLNSTSFVYHQLKVGATASDNEWRYGAGAIRSDGTMNKANETKPSGSVTPPGDVGKISVDSTGVVTLDSVPTFKGFLSDDKKTVVATQTDGTGYILMVIQITGQTYTAGFAPDSISNVHMLAGGTTPAPLWAHWTATTFNGTMVASDWVSDASLTAPVPSSPLVDANGVVTISGDTYHGQISDDGFFTVGTKTLYNGGTPYGYSLVVNTIK